MAEDAICGPLEFKELLVLVFAVVVSFLKAVTISLAFLLFSKVSLFHSQ